MSRLYVILAAALWGCMGIFVRGLNGRGLTSMDIVALRAIVTTAGMFLFLLIYNRKKLRLKIKDLWCFLGTGIASVVFFNFCYFTTILHTSLAVAATLLYTAPAFVVVLSAILFRERLSVLKLGALIAAFVGCCLVTGVLAEKTVLNIEGILLGLGAGFGYALYSIFSRFAIERGYDSMTITFYTFLFASIGCIPFASWSKVGACFLSGAGDASFAIVWTTLTTIAPYLLYTKGLAGMENGKAAVLANVEPVVATLIGIFLFKENLKGTTMAGILLVLIAACLVAIPVKKRADA